MSIGSTSMVALMMISRTWVRSRLQPSQCEEECITRSTRGWKSKHGKQPSIGRKTRLKPNDVATLRVQQVRSIANAPKGSSHIDMQKSVVEIWIFLQYVVSS